jgi:hypothetical protein
LTDNEIYKALEDEWADLESFRKEKLLELLEVCKMIHNIRKSLTEDMIEVLVEDKWREGEVTKALADGVLGLLRAIKALDKPISMEVDRWVSQDGGT